MVVLLDTTVLIDLMGPAGPAKHAADHVVNAGVSRRFEPVVALQSLQELIEVRRRRGTSIEPLVDYSKWIRDTFRLIGHDPQDLDAIFDLTLVNPGLGTGDAMIWSSGTRAGAELLVTRDKSFGRAFGDGWIDPMDSDSLLRLVGDQ